MIITLALLAQAAPAVAKPAPDARAAVVCVRADKGGRRPLTFSGQLVGKRAQPGAFKLPLTPDGIRACKALTDDGCMTVNLFGRSSSFQRSVPKSCGL